MFKMYTQCVLALLALFVGLARSFSWDIVLARADRLEFYNDGILTHSAITALHAIDWIAYDPVHNRVLFTNKYKFKDSASSYDVATGKIHSLIKQKSNRYIRVLAYDPVTELLFGTIKKNIYSFLLKAGSNNEIDGNLEIDLDEWPRHGAVDSCSGYFYWSTFNKSNIIERARFNGSNRELIIGSSNKKRKGLTVDQQAQQLYWIETEDFNDYEFSIESADLNGMNRRTLYSEKESESLPVRLTVSKDYIFWVDTVEKFYWQLAKNPSRKVDVKLNKIPITSFPFGSGTFSYGSEDIAANYEIEEQRPGIKDCKAVKSVPANCSMSNDVDSLFCVHGTKISGESRCECTEGYIGERCDVAVCQNYCLHGDCSASAEGKPKCRCIAGYSGERCEINPCYEYCLNNGICSVNNNNKAVCQCPEHYDGERCNVSACQNYCFQGNCSISSERQPTCRCNTGYSGKRCEINACREYCSNNGVCSLNKNSEPVCQCTARFAGRRCDIPVFLIKCFQTVSTLKNILSADDTPVTLGKVLQSTCASTI